MIVTFTLGSCCGVRGVYIFPVAVVLLLACFKKKKVGEQKDKNIQQAGFPDGHPL
jgi:hypothetical protein